MSKSGRALTKLCIFFLRCAVLGVFLAASVPGLAQEAAGTSDPRRGGRPEDPASDRASLRAEHAVARMLVRLDEELDLGTFPDATPDWPARLAANLENRGDREPAQQLLRRLAVELRGLGVEWSLGSPPEERPDGRPAAGSPAGRERTERIRRIRELVDLVYRKLGLGEGDRVEGAGSNIRRSSRPEEISPAPNRIAPRSGTDSCTGAPVISLGETFGSTFSASNDGRASCGGPTPSPDVWYVFTAPEDGTYTFQTIEDSYYGQFDTVLSLHSACPLPGGESFELACSDDAGASLLSSISYPLSAGQVVGIRVSGYDGATGYYLLRVSLDRTIHGTVTREDNGSPVEGATVEILDQYEYLVAEATTGSDGSYAAAVAAAPELYARVREPGFITELYDDHECTFDVFCPPYTGDPISVSSGDATGIDFALAPGGSIAGSITAADTGEPPSSSRYLRLYDSAGGFVGLAFYHDVSETFEITSLVPGTYYLLASSFGFQDEVWSDVPCPYPCDPTSGTPIVVAAGAEVTGIDFVLDRLGRIEGAVTRDDTSEPVAWEPVLVYDDMGVFRGSGYTDDDGSYEVAGLAPGEYFARTSTAYFLDELYDGLPCDPDCDETAGAPIDVQLNVPVSGIDFVLTPKASISGTVTEAGTGQLLTLDVHLFDASGDYLDTFWYYFEPGRYEFRGLEVGTYFLRAGYSDSSWGYNIAHEGEIYDDLPCDAQCDVTTGTPVVTTATSQVAGIDFELDRRGRIRGTVTDAATGQPLSTSLDVFRLDGTWIAEGYTAGGGVYEIANLAAGSYRVATATDLHRNEVYDDLACAGSCDGSTGTPVHVQPDLVTTGIDFALTRLGSISGRVVDGASGDPLSSNVQLLGPAGQTAASVYAYSGVFTLAGIQPGTYYLRAREDSSYGTYQDELYPDVPCEPDCDLTEGTPIVVGLGSVLTGYDFSLARCPVDSRRDVVSTTLSTSYKALACELVSASDVLLSPGADLLLKSGRSVVLGDGFRMEPGARLRVVIEPAWSED